MPSSKGALVLFSGGQDSATCLAWALQNYARVETIGFDYGQYGAKNLCLSETRLRIDIGENDWADEIARVWCSQF